MSNYQDSNEKYTLGDCIIIMLEMQKLLEKAKNDFQKITEEINNFKSINEKFKSDIEKLTTTIKESTIDNAQSAFDTQFRSRFDDIKRIAENLENFNKLLTNREDMILITKKEYEEMKKNRKKFLGLF